jgi:hypothetical protein
MLLSCGCCRGLATIEARGPKVNQISQLTKNIAGLQKIELAVADTETDRWNSPEVRQTAILVRDTFQKFEQKWRDMLRRNKFFVFCIPSYAGFDGPFVFLQDQFASDEVNHESYSESCKLLKEDIPTIKKAMQDERTSLLSLQNHSNHISTFYELDESSYSLSVLKYSSSPDKAIENWDYSVSESLKKHGLSDRFNIAFADSSSSAEERIKRREVALEHISDSVSASHSESLKNGGTIVNIGNNNTIGVFNSGNMSEIEQINVNIEVFSKSHNEVADGLRKLTDEIQKSELESVAKEEALDAVVTVSAELAKPTEQQKGFRLKNAWEILEKVTKAGDVALKLHPIVIETWHLIVQHLPHMQLS